MAAEYFGTCQICGREQKAHPHAIAKHGYTIRNGWQEGACYGSGGKPYEVSCDLIEGAIEKAKDYIARTEEEIASLKKNPLDENGKCTMLRREQTRNGQLVYPADVTVVMGEAGTPKAIANDGKTVKTWPYYGDVKTVDAAVKELAKEWTKVLRGYIRQAQQSLDYMAERLKNWKPAELRPVTPADRAATGPKVHFAAIKFGRKTGVCVASASGAQSYKITTDDRSKVTCAACLKELARLDDAPRQKAEAAEKERQRQIKSLSSTIRDFQKMIKKETRPEVVLSYTEEMNQYVAELEALQAQAPAAQ
jgi:hypothetical protein